MSLEVVGPVYGSITLQGLSRDGRRAFGVPPGGAFDLESFLLANALIGNPSSTDALELTMGQLTLRAIAKTAFAWVGAGALQGVRVLERDEPFTLSIPSKGCRSYLAVGGGFRTPVQITAGSVLMPKTQGAGAPISIEEPHSLGARPLRLIRGPGSAFLDFPRLLKTEFRASLRMDRVGVRLEPTAWLAHSVELPSEPSTPGVVQVTPGGNPIILGPDGPTIGGYPKIGFVIQADLGRVGQLRPGDPLQFEEVDIETARRIDREEAERLYNRAS